MTQTVDSSTTGGASAVGDAVRDAVGRACARVAPVWPLERFVAVNPYRGLTDQPFTQAAARLASVAGAASTLPAGFYLDALDQGRISEPDLVAALAAHPLGAVLSPDDFVERVRLGASDGPGALRVPTVANVASVHTGHDWTRLATNRVSAWAGSYFDDGYALWRAADPDQSLYASWRHEAAIDRTPEIMGLKGFRATVRALPTDPAEAIAVALAEIDVPEAALEQYLHAVLLQVGGWAAYAQRITFEAGLAGRDDDTLEQFLAVLLAWELGVLRAGARHDVDGAWRLAKGQLRALADEPVGTDALAYRLVLQDAFERAEQRRLIEHLGTARTAPADAAPERASAQAVFCIDVRSEVMRRNLEAVAPSVETIGFAGFFGFPVEYVPIAHETGEAQCPVLLRPAHRVDEVVADPARQDAATDARRRSHHAHRAWKSFKHGAVSCFGFVSPVGLAYLPKLFTDAFGRTRPVHDPAHEGLPGWARHGTQPAAITDIPLDERIRIATGALRAMSLTDGFAPIVLIAGHGASTVNNPYANGLACGACGGHTGEANARIAAAVLNDPDVRAGLAEHGIVVPDDTVFVAGLHDTTTDVVRIFDTSGIPASHAGHLAVLEQQLAQAGHLTRMERAARLGVANAADTDRAVIGRSTDWAQVRPEWGLAGCRAFVVARRQHTAELDLGGRAFLHSYEWEHDDGFGVLELVMTAPMVVASWISLQYYASTVDNDLFGSGNKTLHNVVGRVGVLEGNGGDLRVGLPMQSVHDGEAYQHEPIRLNVVIEAPTEAMNDVLARHDHVRDLCDNGWIHLLAMGPDGRVAHRYVGGLVWEPVAASA